MLTLQISSAIFLRSSFTIIVHVSQTCKSKQVAETWNLKPKPEQVPDWRLEGKLNQVLNLHKNQGENKNNQFKTSLLASLQKS